MFFESLFFEKLERTAQNVAVGGGAVMGATGLTLQEWFGAVGAAVCVASLLLSWHFKTRRDRREQAEHEATLRILEAAASDPDAAAKLAMNSDVGVGK